MSGKGSRQRPVDKKKFDDNYDAIFRKPKIEDKKQPAKEVKKTQK